MHDAESLGKIEEIAALCPPIRVFLLAGNRLLREALGRILRKRPDMVLAGESCDCADAPKGIAEAAADVVLMDSATMPSLTAEFMGSVRHSRPGAHALVIGMDELEAAFLKAIRAGATGYLLRDASAMEVIAAIRSMPPHATSFGWAWARPNRIAGCTSIWNGSTCRLLSP
jgi:DNA-binding NarL/FixJ family response regulator